MESERNLAAGDRSNLPKASRQTLDLLFAHPIARNLAWTDIIALFNNLGSVEHTASNETSIRIGSQHQVMRRPHGKDVTLDEVMAVRHFLTRVGWLMQQPSLPGEALDFLVTVAHLEARIYHMDLRSADRAEQVIRPHETHKNETHERGEHTPEDPVFYERLSQALGAAVPHGRIVVIGHGTGNSDAAQHFVEWLHLHHPGTFQRLAGEVVADLSAITPAQLLDLGRKALA